MAISGSHIWAGRGPEPVGRRGPETSPKVSPMTRGTCGATSSKLIFPKKVAWSPPLKGAQFSDSYPIVLLANLKGLGKKIIPAKKRN